LRAISPIFIVGFPRSGTTLLRFMLASHPRIRIPEETGFIPHLNVSVGRPLKRSEVVSVLTTIRRLNRLWSRLPAAEDIEKRLASPILSELLDLLYRSHLEINDELRWGDKTPLYVRHISLLASIFPDAKIIHLIRDGRDASLSALSKWPRNRWYMDLYYLLRNWSIYVGEGRSDGRKLAAANYMEIRYEQLVTDPRRCAEVICRFIDEDFHESMLDHTIEAASTGIGPHEHHEPQKAIHATSVGRWRRDMSEFEQKLARHVAGDSLREFGYDCVTSDRFTLLERASLVLLTMKYHMTSALRSLGYRAGLLTLNKELRRRRNE